jgi:hypothetical protein
MALTREQLAALGERGPARKRAADRLWRLGATGPSVRRELRLLLTSRPRAEDGRTRRTRA